MHRVLGSDGRGEGKVPPGIRCGRNKTVSERPDRAVVKNMFRFEPFVRAVKTAVKGTYF